MKKPKILVVEDDEVFRLLDERALNAAGYDTVWTDATEKAREYLEEGGIALVVLDVDQIRAKPYGPLLRKQGLRFLQELRADRRFSKKKLPVVGTTIRLPPNEGSWERAVLAADGNAFLEQPIDPAELVSIVKDLLPKRAKETNR